MPSRLRELRTAVLDDRAIFVDGDRDLCTAWPGSRCGAATPRLTELPALRSWLYEIDHAESDGDPFAPDATRS
jgi:hypothetical protein